jgi:2-dehydro-3-deoxy-D-arabinonate dehydratase
MADTQHKHGAIRLYRTTDGPLAERAGRYYAVPEASWDALFNDPGLRQRLARLAEAAPDGEPPGTNILLPPIENQEVWAAGVTYVHSKTARVIEAKDAGGSDFYDRVFAAARPELFFKATPHRVAGHGQAVRIRRDARWNVPEPELALAVNAAGRIFGYTVGNDVSARDIEGENPLYLPQAKVFDQCCGLGPALLIPPEPLPTDTTIRLAILRDGTTVFEDTITLTQMKRDPEDLVAYLFRDNSFPHGCFLLTGTGIVPPDAFTLRPGDRIRITIAPIGTLENYVVQHPS